MWFRSIIIVFFFLLVIWEYIPIAFAGEAILTWDPPTTNTDGSSLTDLGGYMVYYGPTSGLYENITDVGNVTTWNVTNLTEGRIFYFAVTAYDISGNESGFSNEVTKTIIGIPRGNIDTLTPASSNRVDGYDLISLSLSWGTTPGNANWNPLADLDGSGLIDQQDLDILIGNFGAVK